MTRRWLAPAMGLALALSVGFSRPAVAFRLRLGKPKAGASHSATVPVSPSVTGIVQGQPSGKVYTVVSGKRKNKVDISGAKVRTKSGQFAALKPGTFIRAEGTQAGDTLKATTVTVLSGGSKSTGGKKGPAKGGAKAGGMKGKKK